MGLFDDVFGKSEQIDWKKHDHELCGRCSHTRVHHSIACGICGSGKCPSFVTSGIIGMG
jgi:hypothetical protein